MWDRGRYVNHCYSFFLLCHIRLHNKHDLIFYILCHINHWEIAYLAVWTDVNSDINLSLYLFTFWKFKYSELTIGYSVLLCTGVYTDNSQLSSLMIKKSLKPFDFTGFVCSLVHTCTTCKMHTSSYCTVLLVKGWAPCVCSILHWWKEEQIILHTIL